MKCPYCGHGELKVTDSRNAVETNAIRRRRECLACQLRMTTFETVELAIQVIKRNESREEFQIEKVIKGIESACRHSNMSKDQVLGVANRITGELIQKQVQEIEATEIGEMVMSLLKEIDRVAYIRFACVYRRFKDLDDLIQAIQAVVEEKVVSL